VTTSKTADRIPLADMKAIIVAALQPGDYAHDTAWIDGHAAEVPTPERHRVDPGILCSVLPEPDRDGNLDSRQAALSVLGAIEARLGGEYILRAHHLVRRLTEESEQYEAAHVAPGVPATAPGSAARCMVCSSPLPAGSKASRKTCSDSCRQRRSKAMRKAAGEAKAVVLPSARV
jgi:predicted nucleic acid-binding Zn ribbon protein